MKSTLLRTTRPAMLVSLAIAGTLSATGPAAQTRPRPGTADRVQPSGAPHGIDVLVPATPEAARRVTERLDAEMLRTGRVQAVIADEVVDTTVANAAQQASRGAWFIERPRTLATDVAAPTILASAGPTVTLLAQEIVQPVADGAPVRSKMFLRDASGLNYSGARRSYEAQIAVAFVNADAEADNGDLPRPLSVLVQATGASVNPQPVEVTQFGQWYPVRISVSNPKAPYQVTVTAHPADPGTTSALAIVPPIVTFSPRTKRVIGYGIGKVRIGVTTSSIADVAGVTVPVQSDLGELSEDYVRLDENGNGSIALRAAGEGVAHVVAGDPFFGVTEVNFTTPVPFLTLAAVGGLIGAFLQKRGRRRWGKALGVGALSAIVMTLAYAVGFDWVAQLPGASAVAGSGEAVVFVLGVLGSMVGVQTLLPKA